MLKLNYYQTCLFRLTWLFAMAGLCQPAWAQLAPQTYQLLSQHPISISLTGQDAPGFNAYGTFTPTLTTLPASLKQPILAHEATRYTPYTARGRQLANCRFVGTTIELDNKPDTTEWIATVSNGCPPQSPYGLRTFWILQTVNGQLTRVLFADRAQQRLFIANASGWRPISYKIRNSRIEVSYPSGQQAFPAECSSQWVYQQGRYLPMREQIEIFAFNATRNANTWMTLTPAAVGSNQPLPTGCPRN